MKIACVGNFAVYFIPRLIAFDKFLKSKGCELYIVEESNKHRLYHFANDDKSQLNRYVLFGDNEERDLTMYKKRLELVLDGINPDVVITGFISFPFGATGLKWAKDNGKAIIEFDNQRYDTFPRNKIVTWIKYRLLRNVDAFFCPSSAWDETLLKYGFQEKEIFYGLNTSDNEFWSTGIEMKNFQDLGKDFFLTVGRQTSMKNLEGLLEAYNEYFFNGGTTPLVMVGNGPLNDTLKLMAKYNPNVIFIDFQSKDRLKELFCRMKALILPSFKYETWGMVVNEAMAQGAIVAVSQECGCSTTIVKHRENGFVFNPASKKEILEAIVYIDSLKDDDVEMMKQLSISIISDWGVDRFSKGLFDACVFASSNKKIVNSYIDKALIKFWKGRYNYKDTM